MSALQFVPSDEDFRSALNSVDEMLNVEFKCFMNVSDNKVKSKLAKEICALCNSGGGWIVLGRRDKDSFLDDHSVPENSIDNKSINQISAKFLDPAPHCLVKWLKPNESDLKFPIIFVPDFIDFPVISIRNGPEDSRGNVIGITNNTIYTRLSGGQSAPIQSSSQFHRLVQRCIDKHTNRISQVPKREKRIIFKIPRFFARSNGN